MSNLKEILLEKKCCKSIWFMRQAGRYLPEFRKIRSENKNFIELCLNAELSSEITLQPIKRYNLDSAIIFSDILMVPYALGQKVDFIKDKGPKLENFNYEKFTNNNVEKFSKQLAPVYDAIRITRKKLDKKKSLISFVGGPWTILFYMMNMNQNRQEFDFLELENKNFEFILNDLIKYLCIHIENQVNAGADVVQIFDSWAGLLPEKKLKDFCFKPNAEIVKFCKLNKIPNICFPKGIKEKYVDFNMFVKPDGINLDSYIDPVWASQKLKDVVIQGGLDPNMLLKTEEEMFKGATKYIKAFRDIPYVFNLGHGLLPQTDPVRVGKLINFYRNFNG